MRRCIGPRLNLFPIVRRCTGKAEFFLLAAWLYAPIILRVAQWWQDPNYTHGFFVPIFSLFLIWEKRSALAALPVKPAWSGLVILLFALIALALGNMSSDFFFAASRFCF